MLLDLYITHWNEPWSVGEPALRMLSLQRLVGWSKIRVTMVHDGSEAFPEEKFDFLPFKIHQVCLPHGGIARARNWCIENGDAKWIKWCDFDDSFVNVYSIRDIMNVLGDERNDLLWFDLLWEDRPKENRVYLKQDRDPVFVHNKIFRRSFLLDNEIRFNEELTWCEDSAFLAVVEMEIDHEKIGKITSACPIYLYNVRDGSLCNRPEIKFANLQSFFKRHCYVAEEFLKRGHIDEYNTMMVRIMGDSYYACNLAPGITEDRSEHEQRVWEYFDAHRDAFYACRPEMFDMALEAVNRENFDGGEIRKYDLMEWIHAHERGEDQWSRQAI